MTDREWLTALGWAGLAREKAKLLSQFCHWSWDTVFCVFSTPQTCRSPFIFRQPSFRATHKLRYLCNCVISYSSLFVRDVLVRSDGNEKNWFFAIYSFVRDKCGVNAVGHRLSPIYYLNSRRIRLNRRFENKINSMFIPCRRPSEWVSYVCHHSAVFAFISYKTRKIKVNIVLAAGVTSGRHTMYHWFLLFRCRRHFQIIIHLNITLSLSLSFFSARLYHFILSVMTFFRVHFLPITSAWPRTPTRPRCLRLRNFHFYLFSVHIQKQLKFIVRTIIIIIGHIENGAWAYSCLFGHCFVYMHFRPLIYRVEYSSIDPKQQCFPFYPSATAVSLTDCVFMKDIIALQTSSSN